MRNRFVVLASAMVVAGACADAGPAEPGNELGESAAVYLGEALDVMEYNSLHRNEIDWPAFRDETFAEAAASGAREPADAYPVIVSALERLGDHHSFFSPAGPASPEVSARGDGPKAGDDPVAGIVAPGVGYVDVAAFSGGGRRADDFAAQYQDLIRDVDSEGAVCGWVVDLRGNTGGNMWPMVAAIGPILGEDVVGHFIDADSMVSSWFYDDGKAGIDDFTIVEVDQPYSLAEQTPPVAVLTDRRTASSGEAVAVAFRGRDETRAFGEPTWGVSTANAAFPLSDGSVIFLTVATMADRDGTVYGHELAPDVLVGGGTKTGDTRTDLALRTAIGWLRTQPCSRGGA